MSMHRKFQVIVSLGILVSSSMAYINPDFVHLGIASGVLVNMIWVWEPKAKE